MVDGVNTNISSLQVLRASQAFKKASQPARSSQVEDQVSNIQDRVELLDNFKIKTSSNVENPVISKNKDYINDVKQYMNKFGNSNVSDEDIGYAIKYGRSVLVDQMA